MSKESSTRIENAARHRHEARMGYLFKKASESGIGNLYYILGYLTRLGRFSFTESIAARNRGAAKSRKARTLSGSIPCPV